MWSVGACYLKDTLEDAAPASGILGAKLIVPSPTPSPSHSPVPTPISPPFVGSFEYQACYNDTPEARTLDGAFMYSSQASALTLESCASFCSNFTYFGVEGSWECFCGTALRSAANVSSCNLPCSGNGAEICGGASAISVYRYRAGLHASSTTNVTYSNATTTASASARPTSAVNGTAGVWNATGSVRKQLTRHRLSKHGRGVMNLWQ